LEDPDSYAYYREEVGSLMIGIFEPVAKAWNLKRIPETFSFGEIEPDWERMTPFLEKAYERVPAGGIGRLLGGVESDEIITAEQVETDVWEIEIADVRYKAVASLRPLFDPKMERIKC